MKFHALYDSAVNCLLKLSICKIQNEQISIQSSSATKSDDVLHSCRFKTSCILFIYVIIFSNTCTSLPNVLLKLYLLSCFYIYSTFAAILKQVFLSSVLIHILPLNQICQTVSGISHWLGKTNTYFKVYIERENPFPNTFAVSFILPF